MFANRIVAKLLPDANSTATGTIVPEIAIAALVPIAFLTISLLVASAEEIVFVFSQFAGNYQLIGLAEGFAMGTIFAQLVILAIWAGLSPNSTYVRAGYGLLVLIVGAKLIAIFIATCAPTVAMLRNEWLVERGLSYLPPDVVSPLRQTGWLLLVLVYCTVQLALLASRVWGGRCLTFQTQFAQPTKRQFSIRELLGLPLLASVPFLVLRVYFEAKTGLIVIAVTFALLAICLGYAALFVFGFLRERVSVLIVGSLIALGPVLLLPASIYFTGSATMGTYQGVPFLGVVCAAHVGALVVGIPTALFARHIGYRFRTV